MVPLDDPHPFNRKPCCLKGMESTKSAPAINPSCTNLTMRLLPTFSTLPPHLNTFSVVVMYSKPYGQLFNHTQSMVSALQYHPHALVGFQPWASDTLRTKFDLCF
jgi:hypothetical protein